MSREIKFRAWHMPFGSKGPMQQMFRSRASSVLSFAEMNPDAYIVEQFTGLKDSKGQEIYEGDIVKFDLLGKLTILPVLWSDFDAAFTVGMTYLCKYCDRMEVIGNIHENPELMEAEK